jgi:hypothetical protein
LRWDVTQHRRQVRRETQTIVALLAPWLVVLSRCAYGRDWLGHHGRWRSRVSVCRYLWRGRYRVNAAPEAEFAQVAWKTVEPLLNDPAVTA